MARREFFFPYPVRPVYVFPSNVRHAPLGGRMLDTGKENQRQQDDQHCGIKAIDLD